MTFGRDGCGLRERYTSPQDSTPEEVKQTIEKVNAVDFSSRDALKEKRTFGRTPDGIGMYFIRCFNCTIAMAVNSTYVFLNFMNTPPCSVTE